MRVQSLQMLQQGFLERLDDLRRVQHHYPYGVIEAEVARDALESGKLRFARLHAVLRNGLEVISPGVSTVAAIPVREELARSRTGEVTVLLGVPDYSPDQANAFRVGEAPDPRAKFRYIPHAEERADDNTGHTKQRVIVRSLNARLLFDHEDKSGLECLPLVRVRRASGGAGTEFRVEVDRSFVPPCLRLSPPPEYPAGAKPGDKGDDHLSLPGILSELVRLSVQRVEVTRARLGRRLQNQGLTMAALQGVQFRQWIRMLSLSRNASRLLNLQQSLNTTPFEMFLALNETLSELEAFRQGPDSASDRTLRYEHDDPYRLFDRLNNRLEKALMDVEGVEFIEAEFVSDPKRPDVVVTSLKPEFFGDNVTAHYLTIQSTLAIGDLERTMQNRMHFELTIPKELGQGYGGLQLRHDNTPPPGLPDAPDLHYFRVEQSNEPFHQMLWGKVKTGRELAVSRRNPHLALNTATFKLYATLRTANITGQIAN